MTLELYVDGGVITHNPSPFGGTWAFIIVKPDRSIYQSGYGAFRPGVFGLDTVTNNQTEMYAMLRGLARLPAQDNSLIFSDSNVTLGRVNLGWKWSNLPAVFHEMYRLERLRLVNWPNYFFTLLDGHPTAAQLESRRGKRGNPVSVYNKWCDEKCRKAGKMLMHMSDEETYDNITGVTP